MTTPSPYDLNAEAERRKVNQEKDCQHKKTGQSHHPSDSPSPYDLSSHDGLAGLARKARKNPLRFR